MKIMKAYVEQLLHPKIKAILERVRKSGGSADNE